MACCPGSHGAGRAIFWRRWGLPGPLHTMLPWTRTGSQPQGATLFGGTRMEDSLAGTSNDFT